MIYLNAFVFSGAVCALGQVILDKFKLTPGHVTVMFVVLGALLDVFNIYDRFVLWAGGGALVPITSFGHMLTHGAVLGYHDSGFLGLLIGAFDLTSAGICATIIFAFYFSLIFQPKD